jgi:hypothetical protein
MLQLSIIREGRKWPTVWGGYTGGEAEPEWNKESIPAEGQ